MAKVTTTNLPARTLPSKTSVDTNKGSYTVTGATFVNGRRVRGSGEVTNAEGGLTIEQARQIEQQRAQAQAQQEAEQRAKQEAQARAQAQAQEQLQISQKKGEFTGVVQEYNSSGAVVNEKYFYGDRLIGKTIQVGGKTYFQTRTPAKLTFNQGEAKTEVNLTRKGATATTTSSNPPEPFTPYPFNYAPKTNYGNPYVRQRLPFKERIKVTYQTAGKTQYGEPNIRGIVRVGFELTSIGLEKLHLPLGKPVSTTIPEQIAISTFLLGQTTPTTSQIERELYESSKVTVAGVTQTKAGKTIKTEAGFTVSRAGRNVKGFVKSESSLIGQQAGKDVYLTGAKGQTFSRGLEFPTGREVIRSGSVFKTIEFSRVGTSQGLLFSKGAGFIYEQAGKTSFRSASVGIQSGDYLAQVGGSTTKSGGASFNTGLFKMTSITQTSTFQVSSGSGLAGLKTTSIPKAIALQSTKQAVGSAISIPPQTIINPIPLANPTTSTKLIPKQTNINNPLPQPFPQINQQISTPTSTTTFTKGGGGGGSTATNQIQSQTQLQNQATQLNQFPRQDQIQNQLQNQIPNLSQQLRERQKINLSYRNISIQEQNNKKIFSPSIKTPRTNNKPIAFGKSSGQTPSTSGKAIKLYIKESGAFKFRGKFPSIKQATSRGVEITGKTISRSFKIVGANAGVPSGYRRSRKKGQSNVFVELSKTSLSQLGEQLTIQSARKSKRKKR